MEFRKANKQKSKLRLAIAGCSGSGKTYSALQIASGLGGRIAMIDTENGSGDLYAPHFEYDVLTLNAPFEPERFIKAIKAAEQAEYGVLIVDSLTHEWTGVGGVLELHSLAEKANKGNSYTAWNHVSPRHQALIDCILQSNLHIICTLRSKTAYETSSQNNGKMSVRKVGTVPVQRDGLEYEFTVVFDIVPDGHVATCSKDRTSLFDEKQFVPTKETGKQLLDWLNKSSTNAPVAPIAPTTKKSPAPQQDGFPPAIVEERVIREMDYGSRVAKLKACDNLPHLDNTYKKYSLGLDDGEAFNFKSERDLCASKIREDFKAKAASTKNDTVNPDTEATALRSKIFALVNERKIAGKLPKLCIDVSGDEKINHPNKMSLELLHDLLIVLEGK